MTLCGCHAQRVIPRLSRNRAEWVVLKLGDYGKILLRDAFRRGICLHEHSTSPSNVPQGPPFEERASIRAKPLAEESSLRCCSSDSIVRSRGMTRRERNGNLGQFITSHVC